MIGYQMNKIFDYLDELYSNPKPELNYNNDFEFLIAVLLSAQTTDKKVNKVTKVLFSKYDIMSLSNADLKDLEIILQPLGMNKKKSKYIKDLSRELIDRFNGMVPNNIKDLTSLSGVGRKTANLILSSIYNEPFIAVDTHVMRVTKRLKLVNKNDNVLTIEKKLYRIVPKERILRTHQQLVLFGRYKCKAIKPLCEGCKLKDICIYEKRFD